MQIRYFFTLPYCPKNNIQCYFIRWIITDKTNLNFIVNNFVIKDINVFQLKKVRYDFYAQQYSHLSI